MKKAIIFTLSMILVILSLIPSAQACTVMSAADEDSSLFGNNEDWFEKDTFIWFVPGTQGKYGCASVGFENAHPQGGLNEAGLALDWVAFENAAAENFAPAQYTKEDYPGDINRALLETCANVDDVLAFYRKYNDPNLGYASMLVADSTGASAVIAWDWKKNDISVVSVTSGLNCIGYGEAAAGKLFNKNGAVTPDEFRGLLSAAKQPGLTLYSNIFNLETGDIALYNTEDFNNAAHFNLFDELAKGPHIISIPSLFGAEDAPGSDTLNPAMLLPLYLKIIIFAVGAIMLIGIAFMILSLIRCESPNTLKITVRALGIATGAIALILLYLLYIRWYFISAFGFGILGGFAAALAWIFSAAALAQFILTLIAFIRKSFQKPAGAVYIVLSAIALFVAAEFFISGFMIR